MDVAGSITARNLFDDLKDRLQLQWLHGPEDADEAYSISRDDLAARPAAVGFLNLIHPNKVQVLGLEEIDYLDGLDAEELDITTKRMFANHPLAIIVADGLNVPNSILAEAKRAGKRIDVFRDARPRTRQLPPVPRIPQPGAPNHPARRFHGSLHDWRV